MAINNVSSSTFRVSGLATGMDTDQMIKDMMRVERIPLDRMYQKRQLLEWRRDGYRDITNLVRGLKDDYFNNLKMSSNMLSQSSFKKFSVTSINSSTGVTSNAVSATGTSGASQGSHTITVNKLATAASTESEVTTATIGGKTVVQGVSSDFISRNIVGASQIISSNVTAAGFAVTTTFTNESFTLDVDGQNTTITLDGIYGSFEDIASAIQSQITNAGDIQYRVQAQMSGGKFQFGLKGGAETVTLNEVTGGTLAKLGFVGSSATNAAVFTAGSQFSVTAGGQTDTITLAGTYTSEEDIVNAIQGQLLNTGNYVSVSQTGGIMKFTAKGTANAVTLTNVTNDPLSKLNLSSGVTNVISDFDFRGKSFGITLDGTSKTITFDSVGANFANIGDLISDSQYGLQKLIDDAFGANPTDISGTRKVLVSKVAGADMLQFNTVNGASKMSVSAGSSSDALAQLKFNGGEANRIDMGQSLDALSGYFRNSLKFGTLSDGVKQGVSFTINSKTFEFEKTTTLASMMNQINSDSTAKVTISYDDSTDQFKIASDDFGAGNNINIVDGAGSFFDDTNPAAMISKSSLYTLKGSGPVTNFDFSGGAAASFNIVFTDSAGVNVTKTVTLNKAYASLNDLMKNGIDGIEDQLDAVLPNVNTISVSELNGVLKIKLSDTSTYNKMTITGPGAGTSALDKLKFVSGDGTAGYGHSGRDSEVVLDGQTLTRNSNTFTVNGVNYSLLNTSSGEQKVTLGLDADSVVDTIKKFVEKYNEVITTINGKLTEDYSRDYQPLTDDQKSGMSETDIEAWEKKAKAGLLRSDSMLQKVVTDMRKALSDKVTGLSTTLSGIGITTGHYSEKGRLTIDETKLKSALQKDPDSVMNLFTKTSAYAYGDTANRTSRYNEEGLANRLYDVIQDSIRTTRDVYGNKGYLLEKAGMVGDITEIKNQLYEQLYDNAKRITAMEKKLTTKENNYYKKFATMEKLINQMNSQSSSLMSQLGK